MKIVRKLGLTLAALAATTALVSVAAPAHADSTWGFAITTQPVR